MWGVLQAASPLAFPWLDATTVYALGLAAVAAIYVGFAVADGRSTVIAVEVCVGSVFVVVAAVGVTVSGWVLVAGLAGHGLKLRRRRCRRRCSHRRHDPGGHPGGVVTAAGVAGVPERTFVVAATADHVSPATAGCTSAAEPLPLLVTRAGRTASRAAPPFHIRQAGV